MNKKIIVFFSTAALIILLVISIRENLKISQSWAMFVVGFTLALVWDNYLYNNFWRGKPIISYESFMRIGALLSILYFFCMVYIVWTWD